MIADIVLLPGDGIGPEVTQSAREVLECAAAKFGHSFRFAVHAIGGAAIDQCGTPLPAQTLAACRAAHAVFLGAVGGPKWDGLAHRPEAGLLALRRELGVFANLRPVVVPDALLDLSPLRAEVARGTDLVIVRELTGGIYFGEPRGRDGDRAFDTMAYSRPEIERVAQVAFRLAAQRRSRLTSVDKANVLETSKLWREVVNDVAGQWPQVHVEHLLVDAAAMAVVRDPRRIDVLLTENLFGDILSDEAAVLTGSLGMLPSASLGAEGPGLYEPAHGSAPDIAGRSVANPCGAILSAAMLCRWSLGLENEAAQIESAVCATLEAGTLTRDLSQTVPVSTPEFTARVCSFIAEEAGL